MRAVAGARVVAAAATSVRATSVASTTVQTRARTYGDLKDEDRKRHHHSPFFAEIGTVGPICFNALLRGVGGRVTFVHHPKRQVLGGGGAPAPFTTLAPLPISEQQPPTFPSTSRADPPTRAAVCVGGGCLVSQREGRGSSLSSIFHGAAGLQNPPRACLPS
jgi:hypothetical protein